MRDVYTTVGGLATHHLTAGPADGPVVLLLHGGAWGESARTAWVPTIDAVAAAGFRVLAPDWLGFGETAKVRDFTDLAGRMLTHLAELLAHLEIAEVDAVGLSMGGSHLLRSLTAGPRLPVRRLVLVSAGGPPIDKSAGARLMDYDGTDESMRAQVRLAFADPRWADDADYVEARQREAHRPGAYEFFRSLTLRAPWAEPPTGDPIDYAAVDVPTLVLAGALDPLKPAGFAEEVAARIPDARAHVIPAAGHCPQLEAPAEFHRSVIGFFDAEGRPPARARTGAARP